jgi:hypothetical protein
MTEAEWLACEEPEKMFGQGIGGDSERKWRLFMCACCRRIAPLMPDPRSREAIEVSEAFADGAVTDELLGHARQGAHDAAILWYYGAEGVPASSGLASSIAVDVSSHFKLTGRMPKQAASAVGSAASENAAPPDAEQLYDWETAAETAEQATLYRDIFGNPFRPVTFYPAWRTDTVVSLARQMYEARDFGAMSILADALQDAGCDNVDILGHCRDTSLAHVRGCWCVDLVLCNN